MTSHSAVSSTSRRRRAAPSAGHAAQAAVLARAFSQDEGVATRAGSAVLLLEPPHFGEGLVAGLAAPAQLVVAPHHCVLGQHRSQSDDEHLALLVEAADMLRGPQLTVLKRLDLAARDGQSVFAHVRLLLFESSRGPGARKKAGDGKYQLNHPAFWSVLRVHLGLALPRSYQPERKM